MVTLHPYTTPYIKGLKIHINNMDSQESSLLIFYNELGDELMRKKVIGIDHDIDLSTYDLPMLYVKIETSHHTVMRRVLLDRGIE